MRKLTLWICACAMVISTAIYAGIVDKQGTSSSKASAPETEQLQPAAPTFSTQSINFGSYGQDVYELQSRLKLLGFYHGKVDSQFGSKTLNSVKWFQGEFGMKSDGVVGAKTKLKLVNATKHWKPTETPLHKKNNANAGAGGQAAADKGDSLSSGNTMGMSENDLRIMANAVYGESRGEPFEGQVAVAAVILNRVKSPSFPNTASGVIFQPGAFTAVADGQIWLEPNEQARKAVQQALNGWDPSGGCLYYFNPRTATSKWIWTRPQVKTIGQHIFCM